MSSFSTLVVWLVGALHNARSDAVLEKDETLRRDRYPQHVWVSSIHAVEPPTVCTWWPTWQGHTKLAPVWPAFPRRRARKPSIGAGLRTQWVWKPFF